MFSHDAWFKEEMDVLYWYYEESKSYPDVIGQIVKRFRESNLKPKYRIDVIQQLLQQVNESFQSQIRQKELMKLFFFSKGYHQSA